MADCVHALLQGLLSKALYLPGGMAHLAGLPDLAGIGTADAYCVEADMVGLTG